MRHARLILNLVILGLLGLASLASAQLSCEGFGTNAFPECQGKVGTRSVYRVTSLADKGAGSLREAVEQSHRLVRFAVAGTIRLDTDITVRGRNIIVDGYSAPSPGIVIEGRGFRVFGDAGASQIMIRGLRVRNAYGSDSTPSASGICFSVSRGAEDVVIVENSCTGFYHGALNVAHNARRVTAAWNLFADGRDPHNLPVLAANGGRELSLHHNLIVRGSERMPELRGDGKALVADVRNNVILSWAFRGMGIWHGGVANIINNYVFNPSGALANHQRAIYFCQAGSTAPQCSGTDSKQYGRAFIAGNVSGNHQMVGAQTLTSYLNRLGSETKAFAAPAVATQPTCAAAWDVLRHAGYRPHDSTDRAILSSLPQLPGCATTPPSPRPLPTALGTPMPIPEPEPDPEPDPEPEPIPVPDPEPVPDPVPDPSAIALAIGYAEQALLHVQGEPPTKELLLARARLIEALMWLERAHDPQAARDPWPE